LASPNNEPKSEVTPVENADIDKLLSQVGEMADRVENLMTGNKPAPAGTSAPASSDNTPPKTEKTPSAPQPPSDSEKGSELDQAKDIQHLDELAQNQAQSIKEEWNDSDSDFASDSTIEPTGHELDPDESQEIAVDEHADALAEKEINQVLNRLGNRASDPSDKNSSAQEEVPPAVVFPSPVRKLLSVLFVLNYPFIWIPASIRDCLGYIALGTLLFALGLWIIIGIFYSGS
jgi:hypothetical protein